MFTVYLPGLLQVWSGRERSLSARVPSRSRIKRTQSCRFHFSSKRRPDACFRCDSGTPALSRGPRLSMPYWLHRLSPSSPAAGDNQTRSPAAAGDANLCDCTAFSSSKQKQLHQLACMAAGTARRRRPLLPSCPPVKRVLLARSCRSLLADATLGLSGSSSSLALCLATRPYNPR